MRPTPGALYPRLPLRFPFGEQHTIPFASCVTIPYAPVIAITVSIAHQRRDRFVVMVVLVIGPRVIDGHARLPGLKLHAPQNTVIEAAYRQGKLQKLTVTPAIRARDIVLPADFRTSSAGAQ